MLPTVFEFRWDAGHMIFFGVFYAVIAVVVTSLLFITAKSVTDVYRSMKSNNHEPGSALEEKPPIEPDRKLSEQPSVSAKP